jgi:hypothetical protein
MAQCRLRQQLSPVITVMWGLFVLACCLQFAHDVHAVPPFGVQPRIEYPTLPLMQAETCRRSNMSGILLTLNNLPRSLVDENRIEVSVWRFHDGTRTSNAVHPKYMLVSLSNGDLKPSKEHPSVVALSTMVHFYNVTEDIDVLIVLRLTSETAGSAANGPPQHVCTFSQFCVHSTVYPPVTADWFEVNRWWNENIRDTHGARGAELLTVVETSLDAAFNNQSHLQTEALEYPGWSGSQFRHFMNNLGSASGIRYLELGVFYGSTLLSTLYGNHIMAVAMDNWTDELLGSDDSVYDILLLNVAAIKGDNKVEIIRGDTWDAQSPSRILHAFAGQRANVYFYDAAHEDIDHFMALTNYVHVVEDVFVYIVDDWNFEEVRVGTIAAIKALSLEILYQAEVVTASKRYFREPEVKIAPWHNGMSAFILAKPFPVVGVEQPIS